MFIERIIFHEPDEKGQGTIQMSFFERPVKRDGEGRNHEVAVYAQSSDWLPGRASARTVEDWNNRSRFCASSRRSRHLAPDILFRIRYECIGEGLASTRFCDPSVDVVLEPTVQ